MYVVFSYKKKYIFAKKMTKIQKVKKYLKKVKKVLDKGEKICYYNWAPLRKGSDRTLKIKQR